MIGKKKKRNDSKIMEKEIMKEAYFSDVSVAFCFVVLFYIRHFRLLL